VGREDEAARAVRQAHPHEVADCALDPVAFGELLRVVGHLAQDLVEYELAADPAPTPALAREKPGPGAASV
jgi:hypothetical protein